jgi:hypothetical protein
MTSPAHALRDKLCIQTECTFDDGCMCLQAIKSAFADAGGSALERLTAALKECASFQITDSNGNDVPEDSLQEVRKIARRALEQKAPPTPDCNNS